MKFSKAGEDERIASYDKIVKAAESLQSRISSSLQDAYFELILYPVKSATLMNQKIIYASRSIQPGSTFENATNFAKKSLEAFEEIKIVTQKYNNEIANGKWNGIMSWHPRDLAVFKMPKIADTHFLDSMQKIQTSISVMPGNHQEIKSIDAKNYFAKREFSNSIIQTIDGIGFNGSGISLASFQPVATDPGFLKTSYTEYKLQLPPGEYKIKIKCLPTQSIDNDGKLIVGISLNGERPQLLNIHTESESKQWKENVLRGYADAGIKVNISKPDNLLRIYFPDPGVVVNAIEIERN